MTSEALSIIDLILVTKNILIIRAVKRVFETMAFNSGGSNPIGVKTGPRPEDAYVPPVNKETIDSIESKMDKAQSKGETKREGVVGKLSPLSARPRNSQGELLIVGHQGSQMDKGELAKEVAADHESADKLRKK
jgi:hypothetical protein